MASINATATSFRALHIPGTPLVLANVYDRLSAQTIATLPSSQALATASYAVAASIGVSDSDLDLETNLSAAKVISSVAKAHNKPLTVDVQDGYGEQLEETIKSVIALGGVGVNLEDCDRKTGAMFPVDVAAARVRRAMDAAREAGVEAFVVNARCDTVKVGGDMHDLIARGKAYLDAGATTVFPLPGKGGFGVNQVKEFVKAFGGMVNYGLGLGEGNLTVPELASLGVARMSIGPQLQFKVTATLVREAEAILKPAM